MNKTIGKLDKEGLRSLNQPIIAQYLQERSLDLNRNFQIFKDLLIQQIICCYIAFFQFKNIYFYQLLNFLYPGLNKFLLKMGNIIHGWVINAFVNRKNQLRIELHNALSVVLISFNLQTSPNAYAILGVIAYFVDKQGR